MGIEEDVGAVEQAGLSELEVAAQAADGSAALERWRLRYLGAKGEVTQLLRAIGQRPAEERKAFGQRVQQVRALLEERYRATLAAVEQAQLQHQLEAETLDVTLPGRPLTVGVRHPAAQTFYDIIRAFGHLGFQPVEGPEVEWDYFNFQALNVPSDHPARDMWDTFWIDEQRLLRTHTSPMQVRAMRHMEPPLRILSPGRVYRYEAMDATHESQLHQVEGLLVDERSTFADLKGVLIDFARQMFGERRRARFRCDYFPFVEPGAEMAIDCFVCEGEDPHCRVCHGDGWLEILGAGMVHPKVLEYGGFDTARYKGFAFGVGVERIAMLRYGIEDIRLFYANDLRFLRQQRLPTALAPNWELEAPL